MAIQPTELDVARLLAELHSGDFIKRLEIVKVLTAAKVNTEEVINALKSAAETDASAYVREAALTALTGLGVGVRDLKAYVAPPVVAPPLTLNEKLRALVIGFAGWNLVAGLLWELTSWAPMLYAAQWLLLWWAPASLLAVIGLAFTRRWAAGGVLAAIAFNAFVITLILVGSNLHIKPGLGWVSMIIYFTPFWALQFPN